MSDALFWLQLQLTALWADFKTWLRCQQLQIVWWLSIKSEDLAMKAAWMAPRWLVRWCIVRAAAHATTGKYSSQDVALLTWADVARRWEK